MEESPDNESERVLNRAQVLEDELIDIFFLENDSHFTSSIIGRNFKGVQVTELPPSFRCITLIRLQYSPFTNGKVRGDIDVCKIGVKYEAISYDMESWEISNIELDFEEMYAFEVKAMEYSYEENKMYNRKNSFAKFNKHHKQANLHCKQGFDNVALLYLLYNTPHPGVNGSRGIHDWAASANLGMSEFEQFRKSYDSFYKANNEKQKIAYDSIGNIVVPLGTIYGQGLRWAAEIIFPPALRFPKKNLVKQNTDFMINFKKCVSEIFSKDKIIIHSRTVPKLILLMCNNNTCNNVYLIDGYSMLCPKCGSKPTGQHSSNNLPYIDV